MNINRNVVKIVAGVLLAASLPAGAQVLGGNLGGAMNGALGGGLGQGVHGNGDIMGGGSITGPDAGGIAGRVRDHAQQAGQRTKDAATNTAGAARSRVEGARGSASATAQATGSAATAAGSGAAGTASQSGNAATTGAATPPMNTQQDGVLFGGSTSASAEKHTLGRDLSASGAAASEGGVDRSGLRGSSSGQAGVSAKKSDPAPAQ
jgi:hypothetical protein